jgi:hypothetical protein
MSNTSDLWCRECGTRQSTASKYCSNCGAATQGTAPAPTSVTTSVAAGVVTRFCSGCGRGLIASAAICPSCGTPANGLGTLRRGKDKTVAVLLAIFLGGWTWAYLYAKCSKQLWIFVATLATSIVAGVIAMGVVFSSVPVNCNSNQCGTRAATAFIGWFVIVGFIVLANLAVHIWAIIFTATKPAEWYESF